MFLAIINAYLFLLRREVTMTYPLAVIVNAEAGLADQLLVNFASRLTQAGYRVRGLVKRIEGLTVEAESCSTEMALVDIHRRDQYLISQPLGAGSESCCLDPEGVMAASVVLRRALDEAPDLVIANRFGILESGGSGLRDDMVALIGEGIPLITVVAERFYKEWQQFAGGMAEELPATEVAIEAWWQAVHPAQAVAA